MRAIILFTTLLFALLSGPPAFADGLLWARQVIYGMDCAPCAYGIEQGLKALPGVRNVTVSLNNGYAEIELMHENAVTIGEIREIVRNNGFTPKSAQARIVGKLEAANEKLYLSAADIRLELTAPVALHDKLRSLVGQQVELAGQIPADHNERLRVQRIQTEVASADKPSVPE